MTAAMPYPMPWAHILGEAELKPSICIMVDGDVCILSIGKLGFGMSQNYAPFLWW